jgi:[acyl-carrier-protein] S-malonyltransferase
MRTMTDLEAGALIELPPAGTLTGLARRAMPGVALAALKTPDDIPAATKLIAEHGALDPYDGQTDDGQTPEWRLLVAPLAGTFRAGASGAAPTVGAALSPGAEIGHVEQRGGRHLITPPFAATVLEWLVEDGDPVSTGQPLVRLQPHPVRTGR